MASYFGIRIGSTTTCVAVYKEGKSDVIANDAGDRVTPAFISYNDGELSVGLNSSRNPANVIMYVKRLLGHSDLENDEVKQIVKRCPCKIVVAAKEGLAYELAGTDAKTSTKIDVRQALQTIFKQLMDTATSHSGVQGDRYAVLTVPLHFTEHERRLMRKAASAVGFKILQIIHEPAAALMAYRIGEDEAELKNERVVVFRVGGTSTDATVIAVCNGTYRILSTRSRPHLGGEKVTELLAEHLAQEFKRQFRMDIQSNQRSIFKLRQAAETCKWVLSTLTTTSCSVDSLHDGVDFTCQVSRARLESLLTGLIPKFLEVLDEAIASADLKVESIDKVVFCGGALKIPRLRQTLNDYFPNADVFSRFSPDEVLAIGAANQAANLKGLESVLAANEDGPEEDKVMLPTITHQLYYRVLGRSDQELIFDVGTPVPATKKVQLSLRDSAAGEASLEIYELRGGTEAKLAEVTMNDLPNDAKPHASFHVTSENVLEVVLREPSTARVEKLTIA